MRKVPLTNAPGFYALVDDEDYDLVLAWDWRTTLKGYVVCTRPHQKLSHLVTGAPEGMQVDHRNRDKLDNQKRNLRFCTNAQNQANSAKRGGRTSPFKGVSRAKGRSTWRAQIVLQGERVHLGNFREARRAAFAYDRAALRHFGQFARTNFPPRFPRERST